MTTEVTTPKTFEEKMKDRIKDGIGDLITDEELKKIIDRSMYEIFFNPRPNPKKNWNNSEPDTIPPFLYELIKEILLPQMKNLLKEYLETNKEQVMTLMKEVVTNGVGNAVVSSLNSQFQVQLINFQNNIQNQLNASR